MLILVPRFFGLTAVTVFIGSLGIIYPVLASSTARRNAADYSIGWVCALPIELAAALAILDERHPGIQTSRTDDNIYHAGKIGEHNVIIASGGPGTTSASYVAYQMSVSFPHLRFGIMVGIGGGIPSLHNDIRLGDVAVSSPTGSSGGVFQHDYGDAVEGGRIIPKGQLNRPPTVLINAIISLQAIHPKLLGSRMLNTIRGVQERDDRFCRPDASADRLFNAEYKHVEPAKAGPKICSECGKCLRCDSCDHQREIQRGQRVYEYPYIHYGVIASGNQVIKDGIMRDRIASIHNAICFEMEAAGLMNNFPCSVIRGISDYADSHKNKDWQGYAALAAAAYAKEVLLEIPPGLLEQRINSLKLKDTQEYIFNIPLHLPIPAFDDIIGRQTILSLIDDTLLKPKTNNIRLLALVGPGGIGKTRIAIEYAITRQDNYSAIFWISAMDEGSIRNSLVEIVEQIVAEMAAAATYQNSNPDYLLIGKMLRIHGAIDEEGNVSHDSKFSEKIRIALFRWLRLPGNDKWLLIYDNLDDIESFSPKHFLPASGTGSIIITSCRPEFARYDKQIIIEGLSKQEAIDLLSRSVGIETSTKDTQTALNKIVGLLGYMPLAINLAGAFISQTMINLDEYIVYYSNNFTNALSVKPRFGWDYQHDAIATAWEISFSAIESQDKAAASLLLSCSYLNPEDVPHSLWYNAKRGKDQEIEIRMQISKLASYFLVRVVDSKFFSIHPVIHFWARERLKIQERLPVVVQTLEILGGAVKRENVQRENHNWNSTDERKIFAHTESLRKHLEDLAYESILQKESGCVTDLRSLLDTEHDLGEFADSRGSYDAANYWYTVAFTHKTKFLGEEDLSTAMTLHRIGGLFFTLGLYERALRSYYTVLSTYQQKLGPDSPWTLNVTQHIAAVYGSQGRYIEALHHYNLVLVKFEIIFGPNAIPTIKVVNNMAIVLDGVGRYDEAINHYHRALRGYEKLLGYDNPLTLDVSHNLGVTLYKVRKLDEALKYFDRALTGYEEAFGEGNKYTLDSLIGIAAVLQGKGNYDLALQYYQRVLTGYVRIFDREHPDIYSIHGNVAAAFDDLGRYEEAIEHYEIAVRGCKRYLGDCNPSTLDVIHGMAGTLYKRGEYKLALKLYIEAYNGRKKVLGSSHHATIDSDYGIQLVYFRLRSSHLVPLWTSWKSHWNGKYSGAHFFPLPSVTENAAYLRDYLHRERKWG
ncbi:hypothetical protein H072_6745 [Dactylellina haptotyla CBS 200.50]|uniref:Nucleoside phosphorylase domain-containing protein n=1 Tax=Dactylellina haptotyla (strain CBS 200.50) TaxID=1284197 RepID=S8AEC8_DACHA|nr:hypothetical protein H072_6745 [Dactylellina haptotyla CBS 200.50]